MTREQQQQNKQHQPHSPDPPPLWWCINSKSVIVTTTRTIVVPCNNIKSLFLLCVFMIVTIIITSKRLHHIVEKETSSLLDYSMKGTTSLLINKNKESVNETTNNKSKNMDLNGPSSDVVVAGNVVVKNITMTNAGTTKAKITTMKHSNNMTTIIIDNQNNNNNNNKTTKNLILSPQRRRRKVLYTCGFDLWNFGSLIFPEFDHGGRLTYNKLQQQQQQQQQHSVADSSGVLLYGGMDGPCDVDIPTLQSSQFIGNVLFVNTEARKGSKSDEKHLWSNKFYKIGPSSTTTTIDNNNNNMKDYNDHHHPRILPGIYFGTIFLVSTTTKQQQNQFFFSQSKQQQHDGEEERTTAIIILASCSSQRRKAAIELSQILPIHYSPKCRIDEPNSRLVPKKILTSRNSYPQNWKIYSKYKYCLVMENSNTTGYITEKIISAFLGRCVPIYWGNQQEINKLFNPNTFVFYDIDNPKLAIQQLTYLESNETAYQEMIQSQSSSEILLVDGNETIEKYFCFADDIGNATLKRSIRSMMGII